MGKKWTNEEEELCKRLLLEEKSVEDISKIINRSTQAIKSKNHYNWHIKIFREDRWNKKEEELCKKLLYENKTYEEISLILNKSQNAIYQKNYNYFKINLIDNNLTGKTFGRWKVIEKAKNKGKHSAYLCECSCINKTRKIVLSLSLKNGSSQSCGCLNKEIISKINKKYNIYKLSGEYGIGYTLKGEPFYFDLEDYDKIKSYCWNIDKYGYVVSRLEQKVVKLHRLIMDFPKNKQVDHKNHNKCDNRKINLRICNNSQNQMNKIKQKNNTSGIKGVSYDKTYNMWRARIMCNNKNIDLGYYDNINDAEKARKDAEIKYHKEFRYKGD